jgi:Na+-driven multidrug efflux pump
VINFVIIPAMGLSMATAALIGQNIGAGNIARAGQVARLSCLISFVALSVVGAVCYAAAEPIVAFFVPNAPQVIREGAHFIRIVSFSFGFIGLQFALLGVLRAAGEMFQAMATTIVSLWLLQIPLAFALSKHTGLGPDGLWWSLPAANVVAAAIAGVLFLSGRWKTKKLVTPTAALQETVEEQAQM